MRWEYLNEDDVAPARLAQLGQKGWELVGVFAAPGPTSNDDGSYTIRATISDHTVTLGSRHIIPVVSGRMLFKRGARCG